MPEMVKEMKYFFIDPELQLSLDCNGNFMFIIRCVCTDVSWVHFRTIHATRFEVFVADSALQEMYKSFVAVEEWVEPEIGRAINQLCQGQSKLQRRKVMRTLRLLLTGSEVSVDHS